MSPSPRKSGRRKQYDASHQRNWLTGRYAVTEMLSAGVWPFTRLCVTDEARSALPVTTTAFESVTPERLTELCGNRHHQGLAAQMGPFPYRSVDQLPVLLKGVDQPLVVICDRIQDAFNMGAILRCCDASGVTAVVIGEACQVGVTSQVARSSAGAANHVPIVRTADLPATADLLAEHEFQILAASEKASTPAWDVPRLRPSALVIGSEADGIADALLARCQTRLSIPMLGHVGSLNAAVAAGILLYELRRP